MLDRQALFEKLMDFLQSAPTPPDYLGEEPQVEPDNSFAPYQMVAEWIALRHEVKQQGKLWQATQSTLQQALDEVRGEKAQLEESQKQSLAQAAKEEKTLLRELLGVLDALERADSHWQEQLASFTPSSTKPRTFWQRCLAFFKRKERQKISLSPSLRAILVSNQEGVALIRRSLIDILRQRQVMVIAAEGYPFNPQTMYALGRQESASVPENTVIQEVVRGYLWRGQVLREAQVIVSGKRHQE